MKHHKKTIHLKEAFFLAFVFFRPILRQKKGPKPEGSDPVVSAAEVEAPRPLPCEVEAVEVGQPVIDVLVVLHGKSSLTLK